MTTAATEPRIDGELHVKGRHDASAGQMIGPDLSWRFWQVTGAVYDEDTDMTTVHAEVADLGALPAQP